MINDIKTWNAQPQLLWSSYDSHLLLATLAPSILAKYIPFSRVV